MLASWGLLVALGSLMRMPQSVKLPTAEGLSTVIVTFWEALAAKEPEAEEMWHQVPGLPGTPEAVQFKVVPPVFWIVMVWPAGVVLPEVPLKVKLEGEREMVGRP